jgi:WD40 repeat protein
MPHFERRFVRPSHFQVVDALMQAVQSVHAEPASVEEERARWDYFVTELREQPEGQHQWDDSDSPGITRGIVAIAWWTDHLRRRHFRIWAGSSDDGSDQLLRRNDSAPRPPMWHLSPEQVFRRIRADEDIWLAVCACGMAGTPQAIGWMGDRCGCCHYKPAEAPAEAPVHFATLRDSRRLLKQLAFSPDGRWLAGAGRGKDVHLWDVAERRYNGFALANVSETLAVTFTPDSRLLAVASSDRLLHFVQVPSGEAIAEYPIPQEVSRVTIAPDNRTLAILAERTIEVWGRPDAGLPWLPIYVREGKVLCAGFNARGNRLAIGSDKELAVLAIIERGGCPHKWGRRWMYGMPSALTFSADGQSLLSVQQGHTEALVESWLIEREQQTSSHPCYSNPTASAFSPDAQWLAGIQDTTLIIEHVRDQPRRYRLQSGQRNLTALAFSPDGHTLATADQDGAVKLWPWRRLIEV